MGNREERNEYATAKWDAEEVRRQASSEQRRHSDRRRQAKRNRTIIYLACVVLVSCLRLAAGQRRVFAEQALYRGGDHRRGG